MTSHEPPRGMDTGEAPGSFEVGTDGGFYGGQTPTDIGPPRDGAGAPGWLVMLGTAVLVAGLVGGGLSWLGLGVSTVAVASEGAAQSPGEAPADSGIEGVIGLDDELRALARVNATEHAQGLPWAERRALLQRLAAGPHAERVDARLQLSLDLQQAGQAQAPCEAFGEALARVEAAADPYFEPALASARAPAPECAELDERREALRVRLGAAAVEPGGAVAPGEAIAPGEAVVPGEAAAPEKADRDDRRSSRRTHKPRRPDPVASKPVANPSEAKPGPTTKANSQPETKPTTKIGGKLDDELRPFGK